MDWFEALTLAMIQGLTEFLPVSSSGHLSIGAALFRSFDSAEQRSSGLFFAVMLHVGTLAAILLYYRRALWSGAVSLLGLEARSDEPEVGQATTGRALVLRSGWLASVATLPVVVVGLSLKGVVDEAFQSLVVPGVAFLVTAALLVLTTRMGAGSKGPGETTWRDALLVGLAQAVAITPGISRSGATIVAALALGFSRTWAVGFSLLMAVPAILGAAVLEVRDLDGRSLSIEALRMTLVATVVSGVVGYGAIVWLMRIVRLGRLWYFSVYLVLLSAAVLGSAALGGGMAGSWGVGEGRVVIDGQGGRSEALDRPGRLGLDGPGAPRSGAGDDLDRADAAGEGSARQAAGVGLGEGPPKFGRPDLLLVRPLARPAP